MREREGREGEENSSWLPLSWYSHVVCGGRVGV